MMSFFNHIWTTLRESIHRDFWWAELGSALSLVIWATVAVFSPEHLSQKNFWPLLQIFQEGTLERATFTFAFMQLIALVSVNYWARTVAAGLCCFITGCMFLNLCMLGHWPPAGIGFYFAGAFTNAMAMRKNIFLIEPWPTKLELAKVKAQFLRSKP